MQNRSRFATTGVLYALVFGGPGAFAPFLGLWLKANGFAAAQIGVLIAAPLLARPLVAPLMGAWAQGFKTPRIPLICLCCATACGCVALLNVHGFWPTLGAWMVVCTSAGACTPILDVVTLRRAEREGFAFSTPRAMASCATVAGALSLGCLFAHFGSVAAPVWSAFGAVSAAGAAWVVLGANARNLGYSGDLVVPPRRLLPRAKGGAPAVALLLALGAATLVQASHGLHSMSMLSWRARGVDESLCGLLWEAGQVADIGFLWWLSRNPQSPTRLLVWGAAAAMARWAGFAMAPPLAVLFGLQMLHALSFTATYVASVQLIDELTSKRDSLVAQTLNWALATGFSTGVGVLGAGVLYERCGVAGYWAMCGLAGLGLLAALALKRRTSVQGPLRVPAIIPPAPSVTAFALEPVSSMTAPAGL